MPLEHPDPGQLEKLIENRSGQEVRRALDKLPARSRMALVLRYYSDMSYDDIAATLGVRRTFVGVVLLARPPPVARNPRRAGRSEPCRRRRLVIHFDEMACLLYLEGQLDAARSREFDAHVKECTACRDLLHALQHETALLSSAMVEDNEPMPARLLSEQGRSMPSWVWTLAFGAFAAGAYWFWMDGIAPWFDQLSNAGFGSTDLFSMILFSGAFWEGWSDMIDAMQIGAVILLAILAIAWIRRRLRRSVAIAVVMSALLFALALPQGASAAEVRRGRAVLIPGG